MTSPLSKAAIGKWPVVPLGAPGNIDVPSLANSVDLSMAPQRVTSGPPRPPLTAPTYSNNPYYPVIDNGFMNLPSNAEQHFNSNGRYLSQQMVSHTEFNPAGHYDDANWTAPTFGNDGVPQRISESENPECGNQYAPTSAKICKWDGCKYTGSFGREADLLRHVRTAHISPRSFVCSVSGCRKSCSRKDNLEAHHRRVHQNSK
jgi:uncharacterized Zn-finger protein